jgi:hypothetical protein
VDVIIGILIFIAGLYVLSVVLCPFYFKWGLFKWFYHDIMGWHTPDDKPKTFDGLSIHATCKHCGEDIMQDSQGNWFR